MFAILTTFLLVLLPSFLISKINETNLTVSDISAIVLLLVMLSYTHRADKTIAAMCETDNDYYTKIHNKCNKVDNAH